MRKVISFKFPNVTVDIYKYATPLRTTYEAKNGSEFICKANSLEAALAKTIIIKPELFGVEIV